MLAKMQAESKKEEAEAETRIDATKIDETEEIGDIDDIWK